MRVVLRSAVLLVVGGWALTTSARVHVWQSDLTLWADAIRESPEKPRPWVNYGAALHQDDALELAGHAYQMALTLSQRPGRRGLEQRIAYRIAAENLARLRAWPASP